MLGSWSCSGVIYADLATAIRDAIINGNLQPDIRIPAERVLAEELQVSRNSVAGAYRLLRSEGYLHSRRGAGTFSAIPASSATPADSATTAWRPGPPLDGPDEIDLSLACLLPPEPALDSAMLEVALEGAVHTAGAGYDILGIQPLREAVADRFARRGLPTRPSEIMITNGAQHAWALLLRLFVANGDRVLIEVPSHPTVHAAIRTAGGRPMPVPVTTTAGWDSEMIEAALTRGRPALAYLMPDFQNPTGRVMPAAARRAIVRNASTSGTPLVIEDTLGELHLESGQLPPPVASYSNGSSVITVGSMSKICWSGLRVGWIRASATLIDKLARMRHSTDPGNPIVQQQIAVSVLKRYDELVDNRREQVRVQRDALTAALRDRMPEWSFNKPAGGLSLWVDLGRPVSTRLVKAATRQGLRLQPGPRYGLDGTLERYLRIPYVHPAATLADVARRLEIALSYVESSRIPPRGLAER